MRLFLDTASIEEIRSVADWGVIEGITTNQTKFAAEPGVDFVQQIKSIIDLSSGPVSIELTTKTVAEMVEEANRYFSYDPDRVVVKVPMMGDGTGVQVINKIKTYIPVNATVMMNFNQAMLAAKAGSRYVSIFYNRAKDSGLNPVEEIFRTRKLLDATGLKCEIIAGSIRGAQDVSDAFAAGAHIVTITHKVLMEMVHHDRSESTIKDFDEAWAKYLRSTGA